MNHHEKNGPCKIHVTERCQGEYVSKNRSMRTHIHIIEFIQEEVT